MTFLLTQTNSEPISLPPQPPLPSPSYTPPVTSTLPSTITYIEQVTSTEPEKLPSADTLHRITRKDDSKPFHSKLRHPPPNSFVAFPQISFQGNPAFPRNIEDILKYIAANRVKESPRVNKEFFKSTQLHPYFVKDMKILQARDEDPFFRFKPQDPGDVNLLATASLRFAPPVWRNLNTGSNGHKIVGSETNQVDVIQKKPLTITLNIYPMDVEAAASNHMVNVPKQSQQSKKMKPNKMVIHLNLFSESPEIMDVMKKTKSVSKG